MAYTLITPQETRQAAFLVNSLTAAGQEVTEAVYEIAMKDKRFSTRGGKGRKAIGRRGAGRVGGSGLGFDSGQSTSHPEALSDFTPSHTKMENEWMSSVGVAPSKQAEVSTFVVPTGPTVESLARQYQSNAFKSSFVSSGMHGGDQKQKATIVAPKQAKKSRLPPPPVPVTEKPLYSAHSHRSRTHSQNRSAQVTSSQTTGNEFQKAFAAAQEIAARFGGSVSKGNSSGRSDPGQQR